jgi:hypothetical protein
MTFVHSFADKLAIHGPDLYLLFLRYLKRAMKILANSPQVYTVL